MFRNVMANIPRYFNYECNLRQVYVFLYPHPAFKKLLEKAQLDSASLTIKHFRVLMGKGSEHEDSCPMFGTWLSIQHARQTPLATFFVSYNGLAPQFQRIYESQQWCHQNTATSNKPRSFPSVSPNGTSTPYYFKATTISSIYYFKSLNIVS